MSIGKLTMPQAIPSGGGSMPPEMAAMHWKDVVDAQHQRSVGHFDGIVQVDRMATDLV